VSGGLAINIDRIGAGFRSVTGSVECPGNRLEVSGFNRGRGCRVLLLQWVREAAQIGPAGCVEAMYQLVCGHPEHTAVSPQLVKQQSVVGIEYASALPAPDLGTAWAWG
jgi:hypothetical protein